jgi:hypothetical protein
MRKFHVVFHPFPLSDATSEQVCYQDSEEHVIEWFNKNCPQYQIITIWEE